MRCPVPLLSERCRAREGFTLIEVLLALVISVLLWGAISAALGAVLRSASDAESRRRAGVMALSLTGIADGADAENRAFPGWRVDFIGPVSDPEWEGWRIAASATPSEVRLIYRLRAGESALTSVGRPD